MVAKRCLGQAQKAMDKLASGGTQALQQNRDMQITTGQLTAQEHLERMKVFVERPRAIKEKIKDLIDAREAEERPVPAEQVQAIKKFQGRDYLFHIWETLRTDDDLSWIEEQEPDKPDEEGDRALSDMKEVEVLYQRCTERTTDRAASHTEYRASAVYV
jgi:hypothetical protein